MLVDEKEMISFLKSAAGKGILVKGLTLLRNPTEKQITLISLYENYQPLSSNFKVSADSYEQAIRFIKRNYKQVLGSECAGQIILSLVVGTGKPMLRFDLDFDRRLTDMEMKAIETLLNRIFSFYAFWVWGRYEAGKNRLLILQNPEEAHKTEKEKFIGILKDSGYNVSLHETRLYFDLIDSGSKSAKSLIKKHPLRYLRMQYICLYGQLGD